MLNKMVFFLLQSTGRTELERAFSLGAVSEGKGECLFNLVVVAHMGHGLGVLSRQGFVRRDFDGLSILLPVLQEGGGVPMFFQALLHIFGIGDGPFDIAESRRSKVSVVECVQYLRVFVLEPAVRRSAFHVVRPADVVGDGLKDVRVLSRFIVVLCSIVLFSNLAVKQIAVVFLGQKQAVVCNFNGLEGQSFLHPSPESIEEGMVQYFLYRGSSVGVDLEYFLQEIDHVLVLVREQVFYLFVLAGLDRLNYLQRCLISNKVQVLNRRLACHLEYLFKLGDCRVPLEDGLLQEQLREHTAETPNINSFPIGIREQQNFRGPVPPGGDVFCHEQLLVGGIFLERTDETEITKFYLAGFVNEDVGGFDVSVYEFCGVQIIQSVDQLIENVVFVDSFEQGISEGDAEVCFQELFFKIYVLVVGGFVVAEEADDVGVVQSLEVFDFTIGLLCIGGVSECVVYLFEGADVACFFIFCFPDLPIGSLSHLLEYFEGAEQFGIDCVVDFLFHRIIKYAIVKDIQF